MKIKLDQVPEEGIQIDVEEPAEIIDAKLDSVVFSKPVIISVFASKADNTLILAGKVKTEVDLKCGRCLKRFTQVLESKDFNCVCDINGLRDIDVTENIREEILLLLPLKPLCVKNCKGICPQCGQSLNEKKCSCKITKEEIRWAGLDNLKL